MKTLLFLILSLVFSITIVAQEAIPDVIKESFIDHIISGSTSFINMINWLFVVVFIIICWLINDISASEEKFKWLNWYAKIPKILRSLISGILLMTVFYWAFQYKTRIEVVEMLFSILFSMVIYKIGIDKVLNWVSQRLGLKL